MLLNRLLTKGKISLGTVILLFGVLALSWRLHDPTTTRAPVAQTPLTPGMVFVDSVSETSSSTSLLLNGDEEALAPSSSSNGKLPSPLLAKTPTPQSNDLYGSTNSRRRAITETEEILEELEDDTLPELFSPALSHHRRASARSTPPKGIGGHVGDDHEAEESTALLGRPGTGRSYGERRIRKRWSEPSDAEGRRMRGRGDGLQEWWKMRWWRGRDGKEREDESDEGGHRS